MILLRYPPQVASPIRGHFTYNIATPEECTAWDTSDCLKDKVEAQIGQIEKALSATPISTSALQKRIKSAETAWTEFEGQYDELRAIAVKGRVQDQVRAEQDREQYAAFQHRYFEVHARAEDALVNDQNAEDVRLKALNSKQKVQQYTARWKDVHHHIEKSLEEIKTSLEGDAIHSLEVPKVEEDRLMQVKESLKESAGLVDSIITEDP